MADVASQPETPPSITPQTSNKKNTLPLLLANFAIIIALLSFLTQLFFWQLHLKKFQNISERLQRVESLANNNNKSLKQLKDEYQQVIAKPNLTPTQSFNIGNEFAFREAEYLTTMAYYSLIFETNTDVAINLLETADSRLRQVNDPSLIDVRKALANNIIALKMTTRIDVPGLVLRINALSDQILLLTQKNVPVVIPKPANVKIKTIPDWKQRVMDTLEELKGLVSVRRLHQPIKPLLTSDQQFYLLENIRLQLSQAQWAVLHRDQSLYLQGLQRAQQLIQQYFANSNEALKLQQLIGELKNVTLRPPLPDLTQTILLIQNAQRNLETKSATGNVPSATSNIQNTIPTTNQPLVSPPPPTSNSVPDKSPNMNNPIPRAMPS